MVTVATTGHTTNNTGVPNASGTTTTNLSPSVSGKNPSDNPDEPMNSNDEHNNDDNNKRQRPNPDDEIEDIHSHLPNDCQTFYIRFKDDVKFGDGLFKFFDTAFSTSGVHNICFAPSNKKTLENTTPNNITCIEEYPIHPTSNQQHFHWKHLSEPLDMITGYCITVHMYYTMSILGLKKRVVATLWDYDTWMYGNAIWQSQISPVAFLLLTHN